MFPNDIAHFCAMFVERNGGGGRNYTMSQKGATNSFAVALCISAKDQTSSYKIMLYINIV